MPRGTRETEQRGSDDQKTASSGVLVTLRRIAEVLISRWKLLVPLWLATSALLVALIFLLPREYNRNLTLAVTATQSELQAALAQPPPAPAPINNQAVSFLKQASFGPVSVNPQFDPARPQEQVKVQAQSGDRRALADIDPKLVAAVEEGFREAQEVSFGTSVRSQIVSLESQASSQRESLRGIDEQIAQTQPAGPEDIKAVVRLTVLESQRQQILADIASLEAQARAFEGDLENLPELADDPIAVEVASESPVRQGNLRAPAAAFAVLLGFLAAAAVVLRVAARSK